MTSNGQSLSAEEEHACALQDNVLYSLCRPFIVLLRLGGMFFIQPGPMKNFRKVNSVAPSFTVTNSKNVLREYNKNTKNYVIFEKLSKIYCLFASLMVVLFCTRFIYSSSYGFRHNMSGHVNNQNLFLMIGYISYSLWIFQLMCIHFILLHACWKAEGFFRFFLAWDTLRFRCSDVNCELANFHHTVKSRRNFLTAVAVLHLAVQMYSVWGPLLVLGTEYKILRENFMVGFSVFDPWIMTMSMVGSFYANFIYVVPIYFFMMIASVIMFDFRHLAHEVTKNISDDGSAKLVEWLRIRHNLLCVLLDMADKVFSPFILLTLTCGVFQVLMGVFVIYAASLVDLDLMFGLSQLFWNSQYVVQIVCVLVVGSSLTEAVSIQKLERQFYKILRNPQRTLNGADKAWLHYCTVVSPQKFWTADKWISFR